MKIGKVSAEGVELTSCDKIAISLVPLLRCVAVLWLLICPVVHLGGNHPQFSGVLTQSGLPRQRIAKDADAR